MQYRSTGTQTLNVFLKEFCETTSVHGFANAYHTNNRCSRYLWIFLIAFSVAGLCYEIYRIFNDFQSAPYSTSYSFEIPFDGLTFPHVVVCNTNFINASKVNRSGYLNEVVNAAKFMILNPVEDVIGYAFDPDYHYLNRNLIKADPVARSTYLPDVLEHLQYDQTEFIKACFFDQQLCDSFNVSVTETPDLEYGVCYVIKTGSKQTKSGEGLQLILDTHSDLWWIEQPTFGQGVVIRIEKDYNPGILKSYFVLPGHITKIAMSAIHYQMLAMSNCKTDMEREIFNANVTYSQDTCRAECSFRATLKYCSCVRSVPPEYLISPDLQQCLNSSQQSCLKMALRLEKEDIAASSCIRQCLPSCDSWDYRPSISMLKFPADPVRTVLREMYNKTINESRFDDYIVLDIAFDQIQYTEIRQQQSVTPDGFLSQIGGHLGLFLGASVLSVVHLLVVICQTCCMNINKCFKPLRSGE